MKKDIDALHVLPPLERKHRAVAEVTALLDWRLTPVGPDAAADGDVPDRAAVERAVRAALDRHSPRLETVRLLLRQQEAAPPTVCPPVTGVRPELARIAVPAPTLSAYDALVEGAR